MLLLVRVRADPAQPGSMSVISDLADGWRFVRGRVWLWATFASAAVAYLCFMGPVEVLLPSLVKNELEGSARDLGMVFAAGGLGSVACAVAMGQREIPRRGITFIYVVWTLATLAVAGYGLANSFWQLALAALAFNTLETAGTIVWATLKQRHVPRAMLGRVSSLDWLISIGLLPVSFALTGPVAGAIGTRGTLIAAGLVGAAATCAAFLIPGMRDIEREEQRRRSARALHEADPLESADGEAQRAA